MGEWKRWKQLTLCSVLTKRTKTENVLPSTRFLYFTMW